MWESFECSKSRSTKILVKKASSEFLFSRLRMLDTTSAVVSVVGIWSWNTCWNNVIHVHWTSQGLQRHVHLSPFRVTWEKNNVPILHTSRFWLARHIHASDFWAREFFGAREILRVAPFLGTRNSKIFASFSNLAKGLRTRCLRQSHKVHTSH